MEQNINSKEYSIVTACRNRQYNLLKVIDSWEKINPFEIIIVDWGSDNPINIDLFKLSVKHLIKIIRIESDNWILSWAYNEGLRKVKTKYTIKLDCDHLISSNFLIDNQCEPFCLIRGHHRFSEEGQEFTNGAFICCSEILRKIGYFDERIITYGWDDSDLYLRLSDWMKSYRLMKSNSVKHLPQGKGSRVSNQVIKKEDLLAINLNISVEHFCITRNRFLSRLFIYDWGEWNVLETFEERSSYRNKLKADNILFTEMANFTCFFEGKINHYKKIGKEINHETSNEIFDIYCQIFYKDFEEEVIPPCLFIPEIIDE